MSILREEGNIGTDNIGHTGRHQSARDGLGSGWKRCCWQRRCSHTGKPPNPLQDFGVVAGLWLLVALCGNRIRSSTLLPFLFEAQSEDQGRKAVGCLNKMAHCIHA
ncbi:unnamed protein product [Prorocentrum cordatum]|uniref:Uncharacterized protein n=1 Tax=Prorocentrum cordatum TaxID=2364126 RepID=A0ABN9UQV8_9DINO|nr:unnamed protein product [Polarella glacialis]